MPKKLCFVMTDAMSFNSLCRGQLEYFTENYDVDVTLVSGGEVEQYETLAKRNVGRVVRVPLKRRPDAISDFLNLIRLTWFFLFNRFDVVVYSTPKAMLLASLASSVTFQKRRICLIRGRAYEGYKGAKRKIYLMMDWVTIKLSSSVLSISKSLRDAYLIDGFDSNAICVLGEGSSNGVNLDRFTPPLDSRCDRKSFRVTSVGRVCLDKGIKDLEQVIRKVKKVKPLVTFTIVGRTEDDYGERVVQALVAEGLVEYLEYEPGIEKVFQKSDLHIFLTHREGFGNVALEAAACGVPTFAFDVVGVRDSVSNHVSGRLFPFGSLAEISEEIIEAADNPKNLKKEFSDCHEWAANNFEQKMVWQRYFDFYLNGREA